MFLVNLRQVGASAATPLCHSTGSSCASSSHKTRPLSWRSAQLPKESPTSRDRPGAAWKISVSIFKTPAAPSWISFDSESESKVLLMFASILEFVFPNYCHYCVEFSSRFV